MYEIISEAVKNFGVEIIAVILFAIALFVFVIQKRSKHDKYDDKNLSVSGIESNVETQNYASQSQDENHNAEESKSRQEETNQAEEAQSQALKAQDSCKLGMKYQRAGDYERAIYWYKRAAELGDRQREVV